MNQKEVLAVVIGLLIGVGLILHAILPRYEWRAIGEDGTVIVVYDRWSNYLQRAVYDEQGHVKPNEPFKPF
jgi:hypothetical protein